MRAWLEIHLWYKTVLCFIHRTIGLTYRYWGNTYGLNTEYEKAIEHFTRALNYRPDHAKIYLDRGILYWRELDHPRRAIQDLNQALSLDPNLSEAQFNRAIAHQQLREYKEAIVDFQAYLRKGDHPYWREHAENMLKALQDMSAHPEDGKTPPKKNPHA